MWYRSSEFGTGASRRPCTRKWYNCTNHHLYWRMVPQ